jgi:hypothetical protein
MVKKSKKPVLTPALSSEEREKRLPRVGEMKATDLRRFRGLRGIFRENLSPKRGLG